MKPVYTEPAITLYLGNCIPILSAWPDSPSVPIDHVIVDPPYSAHVHNAARRKRLDPSVDAPCATLRNVDLGFAPLSPALRTCIVKTIDRFTSGYSLIFSDLEGVSGWQRALKATRLDLVRICL